MKFYKGVDISSLLELEENGLKLYAEDGQECEALELCKQNGVNSVRLRIWNDPSQVPEARGYCDLEHTVLFAKRIKAQNMHFMLDFHYSDFWADPGKQRKPAAWEALSPEALVQAVYNYTKEVLERLTAEGCQPDMVQVGNEIRSGMLFPDGEVPHFDQLAKLVNAGIQAVRDVNPDIQVMIHLDQGGKYIFLKEWFDSIIEAGLQSFDVIGVSYYPFWHGTFMDLKHSLDALAERYKLPVIVVETAHPWRRCADGFVTEEQEKIAGFCAGVTEQGEVMKLVMNIVASVPNEMGCGVYYWEPLVVPMEGQGSWGNNMGVLNLDGKVLPGFKEFGFEREDYSIEYMEKVFAELERKAKEEAEAMSRMPAGTNLVKNPTFAQGETNWMLIKKQESIQTEINCEEGYLQVSSNQNFDFCVCQDVHIHTAGKYALSVQYRGTNTTDVRVLFYGEQVCCDTKVRVEKNIYPTDDMWMRYDIEGVELQEGTLNIGVWMNTPPVMGKIKEFKLWRVE
ncbi:MAG: glycosyl hydrolase 53 family protein [Agathobacter sp.]|nr:glycosyl hydrolase 53 family protein [Agathobacter sp.]